ncbi:DUF6950 family protein [Falsirhodobacter halotolerans]|uniref:DUF6950 family protein n=1 Tax=Falsirhodobacter halotolerans TaxID=1146892 RepID=UPI001FD1A375|nr:hypothetical protein [Falsirhodobacter halotolerans]MCJ8138439.1 hypothetical protein [Falsirhodobacter halotolerans]
MDRLSDWRARLVDYLTEWRDVPFAYGTADCWIFAMGAAHACTGQDHISGVRDYDTRDAGLSLLREITGRKSHVDFVYRTFGKLPSIWLAMPGDIATIDTHDGIGLGVVQGDSGIYVLTEHDGWQVVPLEKARGVYAVGSRGR